MACEYFSGGFACIWHNFGRYILCGSIPINQNIWVAVIVHALYDFLLYLRYFLFYFSSSMSASREVNKLQGTDHEKERFLVYAKQIFLSIQTIQL